MKRLQTLGGNWNNSVASCPPSAPAASQKVRVASSQFCSRASWVIRRGALSVNLNASNELGPPQQQPLGWHPIKCVVNLDRGEPLRVVRKHLLRGELLGIEASLPFGVVVPGCTDPELPAAPLGHTSKVYRIPNQTTPMMPLAHTLTATERRLVRRLRTPGHVQRFLNDLPYNTEGRPDGPTLRSFRLVVRTWTAHCMEAALAAAVILEQHGYPPLVLSIESEDRLDHVLFLYQSRGRWGSVARSRDLGLHGRKPVFRSVRDLTLSYVDPYVDYSGRITGYGVVDLRVLGNYDWRLSERNVWKTERLLQDAPHRSLITSDRRIDRLRRRFRAFMLRHPGQKPLYFNGQEKWTELPKG